MIDLCGRDLSHFSRNFAGQSDSSVMSVQENAIGVREEEENGVEKEIFFEKIDFPWDLIAQLVAADETVFPLLENSLSKVQQRNLTKT